MNGSRQALFEQVAGALIRDARSRAELTQVELAERAGTGQSAIAAYESGARQPSLPTLYRILEAAGFEPRVRLAPLDEQDLAEREWAESLPATTRDAWRSEQEAIVRERTHTR